jgi:DNA polymerase-3 subunit gamma/tau
MENYIVSARKYRPSTFAQVVGQESITSTLKNAIVTGHLAQAFLFTGPRGVGKTTCARILAKTINCLHPTQDGEPCNECESCRAFNENTSFNIHELDAASNNSVDDIRALVSQVRIPPQAGKYKVYIIDEVHMLSTAAFNAFLKTLEEPPAYAKFILATTEKHKIIPTILSRCQIFDFRRISVDDIAKHLAYVAKSEGIEAEEEALHIIAQKVDGALRDALSTFDQIVSYSGKKITYKDVIENLNILDYEYYFRVTDALLQGDFTSLLLIFDEILQNGFDGQDFLSGLIEHFRQLLVAKNPKTASLLQVGRSLRSRYDDQAARCSTGLLFRALELCNQYDLNYKSSNNKRLHVEIALTQLSSLSQGLPPVETADNSTRSSESRPAYRKPVAAKPVEKKPVEEKEPKPQETVVTEKKEEKQPVSPQPSALTAEAQAPVAETAPRKVRAATTRPGSGQQHGIRNISIKDTLNKMKAGQQGKTETVAPEVVTPFTQEQLEKTWNEFVEGYKSRSPSFALTLSKGNPVLKNDFRIEYHVPNIVIKEDKLNVNVLLDFLKKELNNTRITLKAVVDATTAKTEAYTDRERFEKLSKDYPNLNKLKDTLDLEFGF